MKKILLTVLVLLFVSCGTSYAADPPAVCFNQETADTMVVELQKCRFTETILTETEQKNLDLMSAAEKQAKLTADAEAKFAACSEALGKTDQLMKDKDKVCQEKIDAAKPSLWSIISGALGMFAAGLLVGLLL